MESGVLRRNLKNNRTKETKMKLYKTTALQTLDSRVLLLFSVPMQIHQ
jgi:hypothetical protein